MTNRNKPKVSFIAMAALVGALLSRWHGGGFISGSPKILKALLWSLPIAGCTAKAWYDERYPAVNWVWSISQNIEALNKIHFDVLFNVIIGFVFISVLALCMLTRNTGHGGGMDMATSVKEPGAGREPEKLEYLILWLHPILPRYWYDALLLSIIGLAGALAPAIAIGLINPTAGALVAFGGAFGKASGYMIGWEIFEDGSGEGPKDLNEATEIGELLYGLFYYVSFFTALALVAL
jgi:hypothetical protein